MTAISRLEFGLAAEKMGLIAVQVTWHLPPHTVPSAYDYGFWKKQITKGVCT